jgi:hypothetical protein
MLFPKVLADYEDDKRGENGVGSIRFSLRGFSSIESEVIPKPPGWASGYRVDKSGCQGAGSPTHS